MKKQGIESWHGLRGPRARSFHPFSLRACCWIPEHWHGHGTPCQLRVRWSSRL